MPELHSKHFRIETLAEGVWAAIALEGGAAICNCGIIDLGYQTALFDATLTLQAALDLRAAAEELNGRPVAWVVNSHYHNDHSWGNLVFGDAPTLCSAGTRQLMATDGLEEYQWNLAHAAGELAALQQQAQAAHAERDRDEASRSDHTLWLGYYQGLVDDLPRLIVRLPELTFDQRATLHGDRRSAELITFTGGHTGSDTVLYLPKDGIVFAGDLLFVGCHPFLGDGDPVKLLEALRQIDRRRAGRLCHHARQPAPALWPLALRHPLLRRRALLD